MAKDNLRDVGIQEKKISYEEVLSRAQVERRLHDSSINETAKVLYSASFLEEGKDIIREAKEHLMKEDPRKLFIACIKYIVDKIQNSQQSRKYFWVEKLDTFAIRGLGIKIDDLEYMGKSSDNIFRAQPKWDKIEEHINKVVLGKTFIEKVSVPNDTELWGEEFPLRMSSCDASQHRMKLTVPFFNVNFSTPVVFNNSAGVIKERKHDNPEWIKVVVPKNTQDFEDWVIIGYEDYTNLSEGDYEWAAKAAMDVGQYFVEEVYLLPYGGAAKRPDIHLRDGRAFPQDKAMNCKLKNRHGQLTRESIWRMCTTLKKAKELDVIYCGVSKNVQLKIFSTIIDWYILEVMKEKRWNLTGHVLSDSDVMRYFLHDPDFDSTFKNIYVTCKIIRSFYTVSNFNARTDKQFQNDLNSLAGVLHNRKLSAKQIVEEALKHKVAMFFAGHTKSDEYYIPRYEFVLYDEDLEKVDEIVLKILSAIRLGSFSVDVDHLRTMGRPILIPVPLNYSHNLSKAMGNILAKDWVDRTYSEFAKLIHKKPV